jgi:hypothetical protein
VAIALFGQVEPGVGRVQVFSALAAVGEAARLGSPVEDHVSERAWPAST